MVFNSLLNGHVSRRVLIVDRSELHVDESESAQMIRQVAQDIAYD